MRFWTSHLLFALVSLAITMARADDANRMTVRIDAPGAKSSPSLYGLMTEEINHAYDGGLYAELIQNRIFQDGPPVRNERPRAIRTQPIRLIGRSLKPAPPMAASCWISLTP